MARPKHRTQPGATYFVTTDTWQRRGLFRNAPVAALVEDAIVHYREQGAYLLHRCVIMPDHVHVLVTPGEATSLEKSVQLIKGSSSREIGKRPGMRFPVWHAGFTEHQIRDQRDFDTHVKYIDENPVIAHLAERPADYPWGSSAGKFVLDIWPVASGAKAPSNASVGAAGLKPRPSGALPKNTDAARGNGAVGVAKAMPQRKAPAVAEDTD
jgi:putative transposase